MMSVIDADVTLRPATPDDRAFLREVYASTRDDELAPVPWDDATKQAFLDLQFEAQDREYRARHPHGRFLVIEVAGERAGRLYLSRMPEELRILDIALLGQFRGAGRGEALIRQVMAEADELGVRVSLHVERWNPARRLYERLGFSVRGESDVYFLMERPVS